MVASAPRREALLDLPLERLQGIVAAHDLPAYRAGQIFDWLHIRNASTAEQMTDLPATLRAQLDAQYDVWPMSLTRKIVSGDGSIKYGWLTGEGNPVEAVLMPGFDYGTALCVSSQSGCGMACGFCQTGYMGLKQYLSAGEILQQVYEAEADSGLPIDRVVFMGMGEPLANLRAVRRVIDVLTSGTGNIGGTGVPASGGRSWSPRRITVSTVGIVAPILTMARSYPRVNLALSLHFTTKAGRAKHMPQAESDPQKLAEALFFYRQVNGGKLTIEYTLMRGENDSDDDAKRLAKFANLATYVGATRALPENRLGSSTPGDARVAPTNLIAEALTHEPPTQQQPLPIHVNIIAYNPIISADYKATPERGINHFARILRDAGVPVTVRHSRGQDVAAACGMLGTEMAGSAALRGGEG
jgi:23S rRNA (adenine2503-C2)-methyltransferase